MKRSLLLSAMFIAGILGVLGFTAAEYIDHEEVNATLTAGTFDLTVDGASVLVECELDEVTGFNGLPAYRCAFTLANAGSVPGEIWFLPDSTTLSCVANAGSGEFCDDVADLGPGNVFITEYHDNAAKWWAVPWSSLEGALCQAFGGDNHGAASATGNTPLVLQPGDDVAVHFDIELGSDYVDAPEPLDNPTQGDSITLILHYTMVEAGTGSGGNAPYTCVEADV